jgi:ABC-type molybdate transport system substrate-binding protein
MAPKRALLSLAACLFMWLSQGTAWSAELKVFASRAIWTVLEESGSEFEKNSGHKLNAIMGLSSEFVQRINGGEPFDVIAYVPKRAPQLFASSRRKEWNQFRGDVPRLEKGIVPA